jgi:hypothetical protein
VTATVDPATRLGSDDPETATTTTERRRSALLGDPSLWACLTWVFGLPLAALAVKIIDLNPLTSRGSLVPVVAGIVGGVVVLGFALRYRSDVVVGVAAGAYAVWVGLTLLSSYQGTPFGGSGLLGDSVRLAAMATRYSDTWRPVDGIVPSVPSEYPPLFPWLIGRIADLFDRPAWSLIGYGEATLISAAVLLAFLLWRGIVPTPVALALAVIPPWIFSQPRKSYEIISLAVFVPWALRTFCGRSRTDGGLHWLSAGIIGGLIIQTYQGPLLFSALGLVALIVVAFREHTDRAEYARHLVGTVVTAFVVSAWYVMPYLYATLTHGGRRVNDLFVSAAIVGDPVGIWFLTEPLASPATVLEVVGLAGLVWYLRSSWWARPLLFLTAGAFIYRWIWLIAFVDTSHTMYLHYTTRVIGIVLASAGVLTIVTATPAIARRMTSRSSLREIAILATATLLLVTGAAGLATWMPWPPGLNDVTRPKGTVSPNLAVYAHAEPLPDGARPRYAPRDVTLNWFPAEPIRQVVEGTLGSGARPVTLAYDERMFAYYPWPGYIAVHRPAANTWTHWDERYAELTRIAAIKDPDAFATASAETHFGGIDVFVLRARPVGWTWESRPYGDHRDVQFDPAQFDPRYWEIADSLPNGTVVAVRRP